MDTNWLIGYYLNSDTYKPLEKGYMSSDIQNETKQKMLVTKVGLKFDWMGEFHWSQDCNLEVEPGAQIDLPSVPFTIELDASRGTHQYKPGVTYKLLTENGWELQGKGIVWGRKGKHIMVIKAPERDFEVFISHSNSAEDTLLLEKTIDSFGRCGIATYVAERAPQPGYPLWQKIEASMRRVDAILILWTEAGSKAGDIREEIGIAIGAKRTKRIIPLVQTGLITQGSLIGLEHVPLNIDEPLQALSIAISRAIEWADKKEQGKPKVTLSSSAASESSA